MIQLHVSAPSRPEKAACSSSGAAAKGCSTFGIPGVHHLVLHCKLHLRTRSPSQRRVMAAAQRQQVASKPADVSSLSSLDRRLSLAVFRGVGAQIPRPALMLFEHAGNGLFWLPGRCSYLA